MYDSGLDKQVARWGKRSKKNAVEVAIMEEKEFGRDPFKDEKNEKKVRVVKNRIKQSKNIGRNSGK